MRATLEKLLPQWTMVVLIGVGGLAFQIALARALGSSAFAIYTLAASIAVIIYVIQNGGFRQILIREHAEPSFEIPSIQDLTAQAILYTAGTTLVAVAISAACGFALRSEVVLACAIAIAANFPRILANLISARLLGGGALAADAKWQLVSRLPVFGVTALAALGGMGVKGVLAVLLATQSLVLLLKPSRSMGWRIAYAIDSRLWPTMASLALLDFVTQLYVRQGTFVLFAFVKDLNAIGQFTILLRFLEGYALITAPLAVIFHNHCRKIGRVDGSVLALAIAIVSATSGVVAIAYLLQAYAGASILVAILANDIVALLFGCRGFCWPPGS